MAKKLGTCVRIARKQGLTTTFISITILILIRVTLSFIELGEICHFSGFSTLEYNNCKRIHLHGYSETYYINIIVITWSHFIATQNAVR